MKVKNIDSLKLTEYRYALAIWTDRADFITDKKLTDAEKLLEIRCFDEKGEYRAVRDVPGKDFAVREITGEANKKVEELRTDDAFVKDEDDYLDIDTDRGGWNYPKDSVVYATGGGSYHIPVDNADRIIVRDYYKFDENFGMAFKADSRLVGFRKRGEK